MYRKFWMDTDLLDQALANCDLGDGYKAKVRQYPHKDMLPLLTEVIETKALTDCQKKLQVACRLLQECLDHFEDPYTSPNPMVEMDDFLSQIKTEKLGGE